MLIAVISLNDTAKSEFVKLFLSETYAKFATSTSKFNSAVRSGRVAHGANN